MSGSLGSKQGAIFGSIRNVLICYRLDANQAGATLCPLWGGVWVFAATLFILQVLSFFWDRHGTNACCSHNESVPISPCPQLGSWWTLSRQARVFSDISLASVMLAWKPEDSSESQSIRKYSDQLGTNIGVGPWSKLGDDSNSYCYYYTGLHCWKVYYMASPELEFVCLGSLSPVVQGPQCWWEWMKKAG